MKNFKRNTVIASIFAGALLMGGGTATAGGEMELDEIVYEFSFDYDTRDFRSSQSQRALRSRLVREAGAYCRSMTRRAGIPSYARTCQREVVAAVSDELADAAADYGRYASN